MDSADNDVDAPERVEPGAAAWRDDGGRVVFVDEYGTVDFDAGESCSREHRNIDKADLGSEVSTTGDDLAVDGRIVRRREPARRRRPVDPGDDPDRYEV